MNLKSNKYGSEIGISETGILTISFVEGASVMGVELIGAKMIAPFFGNSIYVWASVLGITLGGLAGGYFIGGIISKKYPQLKTLFYILFAASFLVYIMPSFGKLIMQTSLSMELITATIASCIFFILPPMLFFGMTSPIIINLLAKNGKEPGEMSGKVYAISTAGGILMTFVTGLYLIPYVGLKNSSYLIATALLFCGLSYFIVNRKVITSAAAILISFVLFAGTNKTQKPNKHSNVKILYKNDGLLGQLLVADDLASQKRSLHVNNTAQTFIHLPTQKSYWKYIHRISMYSSFLPEGSNALICGLGGGNLVKEFKHHGFNTDVVEIDKRMEEVAANYFFMNKGDARVIIDDARHYIKTSEKKYDIIVLDMLAAENQPSYIYTLECFKEIQKIMTDRGVLFIHYQNVIAGEHSKAVKSIGKTLIEAGFQTKLIDTQADWNQVNEIMLFASKAAIDLESQSFERRDRFVDPFNLPTGKNIFLTYDFSEGLTLTDDMPRMDFLHMNTLDMTRGSSMRQIIPTLLDEGYEIIE